jgi:uncharacterized membrane protein
MIRLLLGLVVHLATLLALPSLATRTAAARLDALGTGSGFHALAPPGPDTTMPPSPDPFMRLAVCRYDLAGGPVHIRAPVSQSFVSTSFYTREGLNYYALTDRAAADGVIELTVYTGAQLSEVRLRQGPDTPDALRIEAPAEQGFVVLRALVPEASLADQVERTVEKASCVTVPPDAGDEPAPDAPATQ